MNKLAIGLAGAAVLALTLPALAQAPKPAPTPAAKVAIPTKTFFKGQAQGQYLVRDRLIGAKVHDKDGKIIGDIEDVIVNAGNQVEGVVMGVGGFLGAGEKKVGVRYAALKFATKDGKTTVTLPTATKEVLAALDPYKRAEPPKSLLERAKEKAQELTDKTKDSSAVEKAKEATKSAIDKGKAAIETAKEKATPKQ